MSSVETGRMALASIKTLRPKRTTGSCPLLIARATVERRGFVRRWYSSGGHEIARKPALERGERITDGLELEAHAVGDALGDQRLDKEGALCHPSRPLEIGEQSAKRDDEHIDLDAKACAQLERLSFAQSPAPSRAPNTQPA